MEKINNLIAGFILFCFTNINVYSQCIQTEGPIDSLHIYTVSSYDSFIFAGTNAGLFYTNSLTGQWKPLIRAKVSAFSSANNLVFYGGQSTGLIIADFSSANIFLDTFNYGMTIRSLCAIDSFIYIGNKGFSRIALTYDQTYETFNEGFPGNGFYINSITHVNKKLFCATNMGLYVTNINNMIWSLTNAELPAENIGFLKAINDTLFAGIDKNLYISVDTGNTWNVFFIAPSTITSIIEYDGRYYISTLGSGIYTSPVLINNWTMINSGLTDLKVTSLESNKNSLICGTFTDGLFYKADSTWVVNNSGMITTSVYSLTITSSSVIANDANNNIYFTSNGSRWQKFVSNQPFHNSRFGRLCAVGDTTFISTNDLHLATPDLFYTSDNGLTWSFVNSLPFETGDPYFMRSKNGRLYIAEDLLIYYTDNLGITWIEITPSEIIHDCSVESSNPFCDKGIQALILDNDENWIKKINEFPKDYLSSFNFVANTEDALFTNIYLYVYVKSDTCPYWTQVANTPSWNTGIRSYAYSGNTLFITTLCCGVHYTDDYGISWKRLNTADIDTNIIGPLAIKDDILYIGTYGSGVWKYDLKTLDFSKNAKCPCKQNSNKNTIRLFPNPASDYIYVQSDSSKIKQIIIYDITGRFVLSQKVNQIDPIELRDFFDGIYFVTVQTENKSLSSFKLCVSH